MREIARAATCVLPDRRRRGGILTNRRRGPRHPESCRAQEKRPRLQSLEAGGAEIRLELRSGSELEDAVAQVAVGRGIAREPAGKRDRVADPPARERRERPRSGRGRLEHDEPSTGMEDARDLRQRRLAGTQVADAERDRDRIERAVAERQPEAVRAREPGRPSPPRLPVRRDPEHREAHVDPDHRPAGAAEAGERSAAAGAEVEHASRRRGHALPHGLAPGRVLAQRHDPVEQVVAPGDVVEHGRHLARRLGLRALVRCGLGSVHASPGGWCARQGSNL